MKIDLDISFPAPPQLAITEMNMKYIETILDLKRQHNTTESQDTQLCSDGEQLVFSSLHIQYIQYIYIYIYISYIIYHVHAAQAYGRRSESFN